MTAWLRIHNMNGKDYYQVVHDYKKGSEFVLGTERYVEITAAEAALSIDKLTRLYLAEKQGEAERSAAQAAAKEKLGDLVERITRIIMESTQLGEVENAKVFYKKITGEDWKG